MAYDHTKATEIHRQFHAVEHELKTRRGGDLRRADLEILSVEQVVEKFVEAAIAYDDADGTDENEHLYWDLDDVKRELQRRSGDQRRALFILYTHPDIRVRALAAQATRTLAPRLSRHRLNNIDDEEWAPPADGLDIVQAGIEAIFPRRARKPGKLEILSVEELQRRFVDLSLKQSDAEFRNEIAKYNRLYDQLAGIEDELKGRPGDQRPVLVALFEHPDPHVRLLAATATLAVVPAAARKVLEELAASNEYPQAGTAASRLRNLDSGFFKPV